jgi:hypothetical protein
MSTARATSTRPRPLERFKPTNGMFVGWAGLVCAAVAVVWCIVAVHSLAGLRVALGAAFFGLVVWATQLRPRAAAYPHRLVLKNPLRDTSIPFRAIDEVSVRQTLRVVAEGQRHDCIGIGNSVRDELRKSRKKHESLLGHSRWHEFAERAERAAPDQTAMPYQTFVVTRIEELVEQEKRTPSPGEPERVRKTWAWPEVVALAASALAFGVSFLF